MTLSDWIAMLILDAVLDGPSFYPGYDGWDEVYEERNRLMRRARAAGWRMIGSRA